MAFSLVFIIYIFSPIKNTHATPFMNQFYYMVNNPKYDNRPSAKDDGTELAVGAVSTGLCIYLTTIIPTPYNIIFAILTFGCGGLFAKKTNNSG